MRILLGKLGHKVVTADNGAEALRALSNGSFECVLMDIQMPVMGGLEATQEIRTSPQFAALASIPIIALTAYAMPGDRERFLAAGLTDHVTKPVDMQQLRAVLAGLFQ